MISEQLRREIRSIMQKLNEEHGPSMFITSHALDDSDVQFFSKGDKRIIKYMVHHVDDYSDVYIDDMPILPVLFDDDETDDEENWLDNEGHTDDGIDGTDFSKS